MSTETLHEILLAPDTQPRVIADCHALIEQEIKELSGISGTAVKLAYKTVNTFRPGHVRYLTGTLLPGLVDNLEPFWADLPPPVVPTSATTWPSGAMRWRRRCCR